MGINSREDYKLTQNGPRLPAVSSGGIFVLNSQDNPDGFTVCECGEVP